MDRLEPTCSRPTPSELNEMRRGWAFVFTYRMIDCWRKGPKDRYGALVHTEAKLLDMLVSIPHPSGLVIIPRRAISGELQYKLALKDYVRYDLMKDQIFLWKGPDPNAEFLAIPTLGSHLLHGPVAQRSEHPAHNRLVEGSNPSGSKFLSFIKELRENEII